MAAKRTSRSMIKNTAIRACTNVIKTCHGHVLNVCFSATLWTFHFELPRTCCKVHNYGVAEMYVETRMSNEPGLHLILTHIQFSPTCLITDCILREMSIKLLAHVRAPHYYHHSEYCAKGHHCRLESYINKFSRQIFTWTYCIGREGAWADSTQKYHSLIMHCLVLGFFKKDIVLILTFRHFRKCVLIYLYEIRFAKSQVFSVILR